MGNLLFQERLLPTDLLFRNFFETDSFFKSFTDTKPNYPVDIYTTDDGLIFDIAVVGLEKKDIKIEATLNNGLLSILVPIEPEAKPVEIKIN